MSTKRRTAAGSVATAMLIVSASTAWASSHREAPGILSYPQIDGTDFYMFRSYEEDREDYVVLIANYQPLQAPYGGPNYFPLHDEALYEILIDNDGDAIEDITFQFDFDFELLDGGVEIEVGDLSLPVPLRYLGPITEREPRASRADIETYTLAVVAGDRRSGEQEMIAGPSGGEGAFVKPIDNVGQKTLPDYEDYADDFIYDISIPGCDAPGRVFVGQRAEAFAVNLGETFDLVNYVPVEEGAVPGLPGIEQDPDNGELIGDFNVTSLALEVPIDCLLSEDDPQPIIGAWTTSSLPQGSIEDPEDPSFSEFAVFGGAFTQRSRLSAPLVNEVVIGYPEKDDFNTSEPFEDEEFLPFVTNPTFPTILNALFLDPVNNALGANLPTIAPAFYPRTDLVATFLTGIEGLNKPEDVTPSEMMRLNTSIPPTPAGAQGTLGVLSGDLAGFPNGRRPGDDVVDIELRVLMGRLCYPIEVEGQPEPLVLGFCQPEDAPVGNVPFTDGAPITAANLEESFPFLATPIPGSPEEAREGDDE